MLNIMLYLGNEETKMKKRVTTVVISLALALSFCTGAIASGTMQSISAYLNYGIKVLYNGQTQTMKDAQGNTVYPISYNGTTYVPIRAVSNMMGIPVEWDATSNSVVLGTNPEGTDFIENLKPYSSSDVERCKASDGNPISLGGITFNSYILLGCGDLWNDGIYAYYNLSGNYTELTFQAYSGSNRTIVFTGDNDTLLKTIEIKGKALPTTYVVNVSNVQQLCIESDYGSVYITDAIIK